MHFARSFFFFIVTSKVQVQGGVNTLGDIRGTLAAVEHINSALSAIDIDESLAYGLDKEFQAKEVQDDNIGLVYKNGEQHQALNRRYMSALRSANDWCSLAWSGDICLEGRYDSLPGVLTSASLFFHSSYLFFVSCILHGVGVLNYLNSIF